MNHIRGEKIVESYQNSQNTPEVFETYVNALFALCSGDKPLPIPPSSMEELQRIEEGIRGIYRVWKESLLKWLVSKKKCWMIVEHD